MTKLYSDLGQLYWRIIFEPVVNYPPLTMVRDSIIDYLKQEQEVGNIYQVVDVQTRVDDNYPWLLNVRIAIQMKKKEDVTILEDNFCLNCLSRHIPGQPKSCEKAF